MWLSFKVNMFLKKELFRRRMIALRAVLFDEEYLVITHNKDSSGLRMPKSYAHNMTTEKLAHTTGFIYKRTQGQLDSVSLAKEILRK